MEPVNTPTPDLGQLDARNQLIYRIIAFWAFSEALLAGTLHALKLPVTGLVAGSCAVIAIAYLQRVAQSRKVVLKALLLVLAIKGMVSPQTPPGAYLAVTLQGLAGALLLNMRKQPTGFTYLLLCCTFGVFATLESAAQRLVTTTITYGFDFWRVSQEFLLYVNKQAGFISLTIEWLLGIYLSVHFLGGILAGYLAATLPDRIARWQASGRFAALQPAEAVPTTNAAELADSRPRGGFRMWRKALVFVLVVGVALLVFVPHPLLQEKVLRIALRGLLVFLVWRFVLGRLVTRYIQYKLRRSSQKYWQEIAVVTSLMLHIQVVVLQSYADARAASVGWQTPVFWLKCVMVRYFGLYQEKTAVRE